MTNPAVLSRKEVDNWCRELVHENKELKTQIAELSAMLDILVTVKEYEDFIFRMRRKHNLGD